MTNIQLLKLSSAAAALAAFAAPAFAEEMPATTAQAGTPPANEPPASTAVGGSAQGQAPAVDANGEVITVTARRTEESLQHVPAAVSAFSERSLERIQATDPTGLQGAVPNLNIVQGRGSSNAMNIYIRGIGQPDALQTFDPSVGVYVD
ncbi:MAG: iron complex outerrane recepter protein, partial [Sphingomonadales bacterium]|nr:iron complex outerrane recepter protein [Sphingomonadales bacterium]